MNIFHFYFTPDSSTKLQCGSNISRNYVLFRKAGYILKLFNSFYYLQKISVLQFIAFRKVEVIFNLFDSLQYHQKILVLDCFEILSVEYKLQSFDENEFKLV